MLKVVIGYPSKEEERLIMRQNLANDNKEINHILNPDSILRARNAVREVYMDEKIEKYIFQLFFC